MWQARRITTGSQKRRICVVESVSWTVVPERNEDVPNRVVNVSDDPVMLKAGTVITDLEAVWVCNVEGESTPELVSMESADDLLATDE